MAASPRQAWEMRRGTSASVNAEGRTNTITAPAVMPSMASEITKNARWYQATTLVMRVSRISSTRVASATRKTPT